MLGNAHKLYEMDPRIGWRYHQTADATSLPASRLLDPRGPISRTGMPILREGLDHVPPRGGIETPRCSFCREEHTWREPSVWAGGNLMWVHARCWGPS